MAFYAALNSCSCAMETGINFLMKNTGSLCLIASLLLVVFVCSCLFMLSIVRAVLLMDHYLTKTEVDMVKVERIKKKRWRKKPMYYKLNNN